MFLLKQSTAATVQIGPFIDDTDGKTAETGLTISQADVRLSKNGANIAQKNESSAAAHDELGYYACDLDTTDTGTLGRLKLMVHESGALPVWHEFMVVPANVYDSLVGGTDTLEADAIAISGDETAANNAESFFDGTGYAGTNNVIPTVTTLTGHTAQTGDNYARLGAPAGASVSADIATVDGNVDSILTDTGELQTNQGDWATATGFSTHSAADAADAVLDEALSGHVGAGSLGKAVADIETDATAILADTGELQADWVNGGRLDLIVDAILADTNELQTDDIPALIAALNDLSAADVNTQVDLAFTTQMADSVPADGAIPTREQAIYMITQFLLERSVTDTTVTVYKVNGSTGLFTLTINDDSSPTSITRAT